MIFNWWLLPTLLLSGAAVWLGRFCMLRITSRAGRFGALLVGLFLAMPALFYAGYYAFHPEWAWYYQLRSIPGTELLAAGIGLVAGMLPVLIPRSPLISVSVQTFLSVIIAVVVMVPHLKPLIAPLKINKLHDNWQGNVCMQSSGSTCGPACGAMLARQAGKPISEKALARAAYTSRSGTENWYLARALRANGLAVRYQITPRNPVDLPVPAIAGIFPGHFIAILGEGAGGYRIADPLDGERLVKRRDLNREYDFTGFFMVVTAKKNSR